MSALQEVRFPVHQVRNVSEQAVRSVLRSNHACSQGLWFTEVRDAKTAWEECEDVEWVVWALYTIRALGVPFEQVTEVCQVFDERLSRFYKRYLDYDMPLRGEDGLFYPLDSNNRRRQRLFRRRSQFYEVHAALYLAALKALVEWV